jgi:hypothetical protein
MNKIIFPEKPDKHQCTGIMEDGMIVYRCGQCSFVRKLDPINNKMIVEINDSDPYTQHTGLYLYDELKAMYN